MADHADHMERLDRTELETIARLKLRTLLDLAHARSPFYRARLAALPPDDPEALGAIPVLTKEDLVTNTPPESEALLTGPLAAAYLFRSGGTTGAPKFSPFSVDEFKHWVDIFKRTYAAAGLTPDDRVANLFVCGSLYASFIFINRMVEEMGCLNLPFTASATPLSVSAQIERFDVNVLMGIPSWLLEVVSALGPEAARRITKVFYGGENLYPEEREWLHSRLPNLSVLASGGYAAVDSGMIGYQCHASQGGVHHVHADHVILELVDPDTLQPVQPGEVGDILVTTLDRHLMPLIRYRIGDVGRWIDGDCPCGRSMPRFELLGRGGDSLRIGIATVGIEEILPAIAQVPGLSTLAQIVKDRRDRKDQLTVRVERLADTERLAAMRPSQELADLLVEHVRLQKPDLAKLEASGYVLPLVVEILEPNGIGRIPVTGKIRRVVDRARES
jgi:phenylacetate-coenzyme A ligase PaaK-like adenylate-forming protein